MDYQTLRIDREGPLAVVTISREEALNALDATVLTELSHAVAELELDDGLRVVAITGAGKAFVAGADISAMRDMDSRQAQSFAELGGQLGAGIEGSRLPYIAAVNGFALGGGCELALCCDFIYASDRAKLGQPEVKLGVIPGFGGTQRLARRVGVAKAKELCFTGEMIGADEALRIGLVDRVVPGAELLAKVRETATKIAGNGPLAVGEAKRVIHEGQSMSLEAACRLEQLSFGSLFATADQKEGMDAFVGKRSPDFKGS